MLVNKFDKISCNVWQRKLPTNGFHRQTRILNRSTGPILLFLQFHYWYNQWAAIKSKTNSVVGNQTQVTCKADRIVTVQLTVSDVCYAKHTN